MVYQIVDQSSRMSNGIICQMSLADITVNDICRADQIQPDRTRAQRKTRMGIKVHNLVPTCRGDPS